MRKASAPVPPIERPDLYVLARFLDRLSRPPGEPRAEWTKARLQLAVRVNYDLFRRYLAFLESKRMVTIAPNERGRITVRLTAEGEATYMRIVEWIRTVVGEAAL